MNHVSHCVNQVDLGNVLRNLFPSHYVISNARNFGELALAENGSILELDFWIPELKLAFEFQDPHHYVASLHSHEPLTATQQKDAMKKEILTSRGETLIAIPCWWDGKEKSLVHTIRAIRPDLLLAWPEEDKIEEEEGIPLVPPENFFEVGIPTVGALLQPIFASNAFDLVRWWISEKYDGIRVCWHFEKCKFYLRSGKVVRLPGAFLQDVAPIFLDGEIWFGRGSFHEPHAILLNFQHSSSSSSSTSSSPSSPVSPLSGGSIARIAWHLLRFVVFDSVRVSGHAQADDPFELRFRELLSETNPEHPFALEAAMHKATSTEYVHKTLKELLVEGGEGVVARAPNSEYVHGRTPSVLKFKAHKDQEALVVEIEHDAEGHVNYVLKLNDNVTIKAQLSPMMTSGGQQLGDPQPGDVVTFYYNMVNAQGVPSNAAILRVRKDLTWDSVLYSNSRESDLNSISESALANRRRKASGYWTIDESKNTRIFLDQFARSRGFDPLVPQNWLSISTRDIVAAGGVGFLGNYKGSLIKCLVDVYPEIGIRITTRNKLPQRYWKEHENRKQVFDNVAKRMKFDPLLQKNWYWVTRRDIHSEKGGSSVLDYYEGSIGDALKDIYPTVPWHEPNFYRKYWHEPLNRRKFFDSYAKAMGFDPLVASNWYSVTADSVLKHSGGYAVLEFHPSLQAALKELYPNIGLEDTKFRRMRFGYWNSETRRDFFDRFAKEHGFEPLVANNWYKFTYNDIIAAKGGFSALAAYGGSLFKALIDLYPEIEVDSSLFSAVPARHWRDPENRRTMLMRIAKQRGLDPLSPDTWRKITAKDIKKLGGGRHLLQETKGIQNAIRQAFPELKLAVQKVKKSPVSPSIWDRMHVE